MRVGMAAKMRRDGRRYNYLGGMTAQLIVLCLVGNGRVVALYPANAPIRAFST